MHRFLFAFLLVIGLPFAAHAQFYVCVSNCVNGATPSDANNGTSLATPFLTIGKAQTSMQGGGTKKTYIEAGTYTMGTSQFTGGANWNFTSSDNGETFASYGGGQVIISGGGSPNINNFEVIGASGLTSLTIKGLTFQNTGGAGTHQVGVSSGVFFAGALATPTNITLQYNTFTGCWDYCVLLSGINGATIDSNHCQNVASANINTGSCFSSGANTGGIANVMVSHNLCENMYYGCTDFNGQNTSLGIFNITYDGNVVVNACLKAIALNDSDCGALYMSDRFGGGTNIKIINNVVMGANVDVLDTNQSPPTTTQAKGIYLDDCGSNVTITGNLLFNNVGLFPLFLHGSQNVSISNNVFVLASGGATGAELFGYSRNFAGRCSQTDGFTMAGNTFQNNVVWMQGNWPTATGLWETLGTAPVNPPTIANNMYYMQTGVNFRNNGQYADTAPIICGPSQGNSPLGNISPQQLWTMLANGVISSWQQIAVNQGPTFRGCAAGQF